MATTSTGRRRRADLPPALVSPFNRTKLLRATLLGLGDLPGVDFSATGTFIVAGGLRVVRRERRT